MLLNFNYVICFCKNNKNNDYFELVFVVMLIIDNMIICFCKDYKIIFVV